MTNRLGGVYFVPRAAVYPSPPCYHLRNNIGMSR